MKLLCIGNSFSEDATYYLKKQADSADFPLTVVNLYIGGCSVSTHAANICADAPLYRYERNGIITARKTSVCEALREEAWDVVTVQQQSGNAGLYEGYEKIGVILDCIKANAPQAKILFHQTWGYEIDSDHPDFAHYQNDQATMVNAIRETSLRVCREQGIGQIISCGELIAALRKSPDFDYQNGGESLCRDGFHMHLVYGRYALGLCFLKALGGEVEKVSFVPKWEDIINGYAMDAFSCEQEKLARIKHTVMAGGFELTV